MNFEGKIMLKLKSWIAALACATVLALPAHAQEAESDVPVNAQFGAWVVSCLAVTVNSNVCRLIQEQILRDSNALVVRFIAQPSEEGSAVMLAQVPISVFLAGGAVYRLEGDDDTPQREMIWQRCGGDLCEAAILLDADELTAMNDAGAILFGYRTDPATEPIITRVDLAEFAEGLEALR
jgi:invasion protein IalB